MDNCVYFVRIILIAGHFLTFSCSNFDITEELANGTEIEGVESYIKGTEVHADAHYSIFGNEPLSRLVRIDSRSAKLFVNGRIDREALCPDQRYRPELDYQPNYRCLQKVQVLVRSLSSATTSRIELSIRILDINDNTPNWSQPELVRSFLESSDSGQLGRPVTLERANDPDANDNGRIIYSLQASSSGYNLPFKIENQKESFRLVPTARLDREERANYTLLLLATDRGHIQRTGSVRLKIVIEDINDHAPIFNETIYRIDGTILESTPVGKVVLTVFALDKDSGRHGRVIYKMSPEASFQAKSYFKVSSNGQVIVKKKLDYDRKVNKFRFQVIAEDSAPYPYQKFSTAEVIIELFDENDEKPEITAHFLHIDPRTNLPVVNESSSPRTQIAYVIVKDLDYGETDRVDCTLSNSNFSMLPDSGKLHEYVLSTTTYFDRETTPLQKLTITCKDAGKNRQEATFTIKISDANDQDPVFPSTFHFSLRENMPPGTVINGKLVAKDADEGINADMNYFIDPSFEHNFTVNPSSGIITSKVTFDRELCAQYSIRVLAVDKGFPPRTGTGTVDLSITDENDWAPKFTRNRDFYNNIIVSEGVKAYDTVATIEATDQDAGNNKKITYRLINENSGTFTINPRSGKIRANRRLNREVKAIYTMDIVAEDHGKPRPLSATMAVTITVDDINDNAPVFVVPNRTNSEFNIDSGDALGKQVLTAFAKDADDKENGKVRYRIKSGDLSKQFIMDEDTGVLFLSQSFRGKNKNKFALILQACDKGVPTKCSDSVTVKISVSNKEGNAPDINNPPTTAGNEAIIICLAVIFAILVLATIVLICLIKRKSFWTRKAKKPNVSQPSLPGDLNNPDDLRKHDNTPYEGDTLLAKAAAHGSTVYLDDMDGNTKKKQLYAARMHGMTPTIRRVSEPGIDLAPRPSSPDYQTLDSVCGTYRPRGGNGGPQMDMSMTSGVGLNLPSHLPQYSTGGFLMAPSCLPGDGQAIYSPAQLQHTYYEINTGGMPTPVDSRRCQTMGRPRPPPRAPCDYGTHVFRPIPLVTQEEAGVSDRYDIRTLERHNKGKYTYEAYKEASFV